MNKSLSGWLIAGGLFAWALAFVVGRKERQQNTAVITHPEQTANQDQDMQTETSLPRGYRNNNPLNIRISNNKWQGKVARSENTDGVFEQFVSMAYGYRAAMVLIRNYINKYGCDTLTKIITRWAPPSENNTASYIANVAKRMGVSPADYISPNDKDQMTSLMYAMSISENGSKVLPDGYAINQAWELLNASA